MHGRWTEIPFLGLLCVVVLRQQIDSNQCNEVPSLCIFTAPNLFFRPESSAAHEDIMKALSVAGLAIVCSSIIAEAQTAQNLVGTWEAVSIVNTAKDGAKTDVFGPNVKGILIFEANGRFAQIVMRPGLPKFASDNRLQGTPEE